MCGLIKLMVYRNGVTNVWHVYPDELKQTRSRLSQRGLDHYPHEAL